MTPIQHSPLLFGARRPVLRSQTTAAQPILDDLAQNADKITDWGWRARLDGELYRYAMSGKLGDRFFHFDTDRTEFATTRRKGITVKTFPIQTNLLVTNTSDSDPKAFCLLKKPFDRLFKKLVMAAQASLGKELGLGPMMDLSGTLADLTAKTAQGELKWTYSGDGSLASSLGAEFQGQANYTAINPQDNTEYRLRNNVLWGRDPERFKTLEIRQTGRPQRVILISSESELKAYDMLMQGMASYINEAEVQEQVDAAKQELADLRKTLRQFPKQRTALAKTAAQFKAGLPQ